MNPLEKKCLPSADAQALSYGEKKEQQVKEKGKDSALVSAT